MSGSAKSGFNKGTSLKYRRYLDFLHLFLKISAENEKKSSVEKENGKKGGGTRSQMWLASRKEKDQLKQQQCVHRTFLVLELD